MEKLFILIAIILIAILIYHFKDEMNINSIGSSIKSFFSKNVKEIEKIDKYFDSIKISNPPKDYLESEFIRDASGANTFRTNNKEYTVFPLCCQRCKINAYKALKYSEDINPAVSEVKNKFITNIYPNSNTQLSDLYLVMEREPIKLLVESDVKSINLESFRNILRFIDMFSKKNNEYITDLTINNIGIVNNNLKIINLNCTQKIYNDNIYYPKYSILHRLNPELFGKGKNIYLRIAKLIKEGEFHL